MEISTHAVVNEFCHICRLVGGESTREGGWSMARENSISHLHLAVSFDSQCYNRVKQESLIEVS